MFPSSHILLRSVISAMLAVFVSLPLAVSAIEYAGIGGRPGYPRPDNPRSESIFIHDVTPGETIEEAVVVMNNTPERKTLLVYPADSTPSSGGGYACKQLLEEQNGVGSWITMETAEVSLEPHTYQVVPFTITVPENADVGEHNGCVLIQEKPGPADEQASGMHLSLRTGLRVALTVPGDLNRDVTVTAFDASRGTFGTAHYDASLENKGNVSADTDVSVVTESFFGKSVFTHGGRFTVLRGETLDLSFDLPARFWGGIYRVEMRAAYDDAPETPLQTASEMLLVLPTIAGMLAETGIALIVLMLLLSLRRRQQTAKQVRRDWKRYRVKNAASIQDLAKKLGVSWKQIARVNKLKAPYTIRSGDTLKLPPTSKR